jgi:hypothetical protein
MLVAWTIVEQVAKPGFFVKSGFSRFFDPARKAL